MSEITIEEHWYRSSGYIYKDLSKKTKTTTFTKICIAVMSLGITIPAALAISYGPDALMSYFILGLIFAVMCAVYDINNFNITKQIYKYSKRASFDNEESKEVAKLLIKIARYEKQLENFTTPELLYDEIFDKLNGYQELKNFDRAAANKNIADYTERLEKLFIVLEKKKLESIFSSKEQLDSTLIMMGELPEDK